MNLEDVIDPEYGLQQDEWSLSKPVFGDEGQLEVVGWSGKRQNARIYIIKCTKCSQDPELFGSGYFKIIKWELMVRNSIPCGCSKKVNWSKEQYEVLCKRKCLEAGYKFLGFTEPWQGAKTFLNICCPNHGEWSSSNINNLLSGGAGCKKCGLALVRYKQTTEDSKMITAFIKSGAFPKGTEFKRSAKRDKRGSGSYWRVDCPVCGEHYESQSWSLKKGVVGCACSRFSQRYAYINMVYDSADLPIFLKFGITKNPHRRVASQENKSVYSIKIIIYLYFLT